MRGLRMWPVVAVLLLVLTVPVLAANSDPSRDLAAQTWEELRAGLDVETLGVLDAVAPEEGDWSGVSFDSLKEILQRDLQTSLRETLRTFLSLLPLLLVFAFVSLLVGEDRADAVQTAGVCVLVLQSLPLVRPLLAGAAALLETVAGFMRVFLPVYAGLAAFSGAPGAAVRVQSLSFGLCEGLSALAHTLCVKGVYAFLGVFVACALGTLFPLQKVLSNVNRAVSWVLSLGCAVFTGVLSASGVLSAAADHAAGKSVRFLLSSSLPIVGAAMSDAYSALLSSIHLIRGSVAAAGVAVLLAVSAPVLVQNLSALCCFKALSAVSGALGVSKTAQVCAGFALALKYVLLLAVLELFLLLIAIGLLLQLKGGV